MFKNTLSFFKNIKSIKSNVDIKNNRINNKSKKSSSKPKSHTNLLRPKLYKEYFFSQCIEIGNSKLYPFYETSIIASNKNIIGTCSIDPIAIVSSIIINNTIEYFLFYFDESIRNEEMDKKILEKFCKEINYEI